MADFFKLLDPEKDIKTQNFASQNSLLSMTGQAQATSNDVNIYTVGPFSGNFINIPDSLGSSTAGISPSGAINSIAKVFFNRYSSQYFNSTSGVYTLPAAHVVNTNVVAAKVIQVADPTRDHGIYPDSLTCVLTYNGSSLTAIDSVRDSFGPNKENLSFGKLTDINNADHVIGSIYYDAGLVVLHGGTGSASALYQSSVSGFAFRGSITGALTASTSASHVIVESLSFRTYKMLTRNIYFVRALANEFNYTSNPSAQYVEFLQDPNNALTYITTIGLYDDRDNLLAVAKVSPPVKKTQWNEHLFAITLSI